MGSPLRSTYPTIELLEGAPFAAAHLRFQRFGYALARTIPQRNLTNVLVRQAKFSGDSSTQPPRLLRDKDWVWSRIHGWNEPQQGAYGNAIGQVKKIMPVARRPRSVSGLGPKLKELRLMTGLGQIAFAQFLGVDQGSLAKWETGARPLPAAVIMAIVDSLPDMAQKDDWLKHAGVRLQNPPSSSTREVPLLRDAAACGTSRAMDENEIERILCFPRDLLPPGGSLYAIKVTGDSMSPILEEGYIALVETTQREVKTLENCMVVARDGDAVTVKWLRKQDTMYLLVPQHTSQRHPVVVWTSGENRAIVGQVVKWICEPPIIRKRK
jgi:SOS-response transcriptional repressor LexA